MTVTKLASRPIIFASPYFPPDILQVLQSLDQHQLLKTFITTWGVPDRPWVKHLPSRIKSRLRTRLLSANVADRTEYYPFRELVRGSSRLLGLSPVKRDRIWYWAETAFDRYVARRYAGKSPALYGVEHALAAAFEKQKALGGHTLLWQVIAHPQYLNRVLLEEYDRYPEVVTPYLQLWRSNLPANTARKLRQIAATDLIIANSDFVRQTFLDAGLPSHRVVSVPSACPPVPKEADESRQPSKKLTVVCAGTLNMRKGVHILLQAWRKLNPHAGAELILIGDMLLPEKLTQNLPASVQIRPRMPRPELHAFFRQASLFVLPTLVEGRANVILEAVVNALPVVTTPTSGCTDVIRDGETGFLVAPGDADQLTDRISWALDHPSEASEMGRAAQALARKWQIEDFAVEHAAVIRRFLNVLNSI